MNDHNEKSSANSGAETGSQPVEPEVVPLIREKNLKSAKNVTTLVYALQAASILVGVTFLIGVIVNYVKLEDARDTWLETHFRWQIRTFWFAFLWGTIGILTLGLGIGLLILTANSVWFIYRVIKGWLNLNDGKEMYI